MKAVACLILLSLIPVGAGIVRMVRLATGEEITADNARFFASPAPVVIHIVTVAVFCIIGAFQFDPGFRSRNPQWHRLAGRCVFVSGIAAALSGLWMTQFYPLRPDLQGNLLYGIRMLVSPAMVLFLILSFIAIRNRNIVNHKAWVIRGYALGQGAGTQALLLIPWTLIVGKPELFTYELLMVAGWLANVIFAEWFIRRSDWRKFLNLQIAS
jgi:uncharacterized membrane protein